MSFTFGIRFEVALGVLDAQLSRYAEAMAIERSKAQPNTNNIEHIDSAACEIRALREKLNPRDAKAIGRVISNYGKKAKAG